MLFGSADFRRNSPRDIELRQSIGAETHFQHYKLFFLNRADNKKLRKMYRPTIANWFFKCRYEAMKNARKTSGVCKKCGVTYFFPSQLFNWFIVQSLARPLFRRAQHKSDKVRSERNGPAKCVVQICSSVPSTLRPRGPWQRAPKREEEKPLIAGVIKAFLLP